MVNFFTQVKNIKNKTPKGFTLVETLVAISIFTVSIMTMMVVLGSSIASTTYSKNKVIATYLAQEGIEDIRNMRDTYMHFNADPQAGWATFVARFPAPASCVASTLVTNIPASNNGCFFNADSVNPTPIISAISFSDCTSIACANAPLLYDSSTGKYGYTATGTTKNSSFTRKINVDTSLVEGGANPGGVKEIKVFSTVYWIQGSTTMSVSLAENLFNWVE